MTMRGSKFVTPPTLTVTEHALFRYCQRALGAEIQWLKEQILKDIRASHARLGDGNYPIGDGSIIAIVMNNTVITIYTKADIKSNGAPLMKSKAVQRHLKKVY